ncbi:PKD domain-containing protein [Fibrella forsythiae]|uniref:PKD/Chitinase domain-containing protein n=1 Tax=Fibrella forsythiae TaxID=2817061 RepID=A0ABS3JHZ0_9BACT|nr:REJ domain-containing protein [Fibrella forsythiae]MBO0949629.1 hypothetical protein [Fibrella forsythiae]
MKWVSPSLIYTFVLLAALFTSCKQTDKPAPPQPPVVKVATTTTSATLGSSVVLDGSGSTDPQGQALTYKWTIKSQPDGSKATITNPTSLTAGFVPDKPGTYVLVLTVTASGGLSTSSEITVTVAIPGKPPVVNAGVSSTVSTGRKVTLDGSKTSDPDGDKLTYLWTIKSKPTGSAATITNATSPIAEFTPDLLGTYVFSLSVTDGNWPTVSADVTVTVTIPVVKEITGRWNTTDGTGGGNEYTPRNHFYTFDVATNNQPISLSLTSSDVNVGFYIYNPLGQEVNRSGFGRNQTGDIVVNAGTYTVMVCSGQRYDIGNYVLKGRGFGSEFTRIPALNGRAANISFGPEGGGGTVFTPRNHYYTFEVTADNSVTDINMQSAQMPVWLTLIGPSGAEVDRNSFVGTPRYLINKLNKGVYGLWASSGSRDAIGTYTLDIFGQVQNLKQYVFESSTIADTYRGKNAPTVYTVNVTTDNTILDISLRSPDIRGAIYLADPNGTQVAANSFYENYNYILKDVRKGQYKITIEPDRNSSGIGNYTLSVYGKFTDLKKQ